MLGFGQNSFRESTKVRPVAARLIAIAEYEWTIRSNTTGFVKLTGKAMDGKAAKSLPLLGFLTVVDSPAHGLFGGYLVLSCAGRPLEFHCTAPVRASRAQKILYGPTLEPFLYGEQIGRSLIANSKLQPSAVLTNSRPVLATGQFTELPVVLIDNSAGTGNNRPVAPSETQMLDQVTAKPTSVKVGEYFVELPAGDHATIIKQLREISQQIDLLEPFDRIDEAIREAQRVGESTRDVA